MVKLVELWRREWLLVAGMAAAVLAGWYSAMGGDKASLAVGGGLALLMVVAGTMKRPQVAPYFLVTFTVFDRNIKLSETYSVSTLTIMLVLLAPAFLMVIVQEKVVPRFALAGAGALVVGLALACVVAGEPVLALDGLLRWVPVLIMVMGVASLCATQSGLSKKLGLAIVIGGAVCGVFGILQRSGHYWLVGPPYAPEVVDSTFGYYTNFANFEALAAVVGVGLIAAGVRVRRLPIIATAATLVCLYMVVTSFSRGALVLLGTGLTVILARELARPGRFISAVAGLGFLAWLTMVLTPAEYLQEIEAKFTTIQGGDAVRSQLQAGGIDLLLHSPMGIGFNNFSELVASGKVYAPLALAHAHNTFVQMGLDAGWLGAGGFLILVLGAAWRAFRSRGGTMTAAYGAALVGFLVQVSQDYFFFEEASLVAFGLLLAGSLGVLREDFAVDDGALGVSNGAAGDRGGQVRLGAYRAG